MNSLLYGSSDTTDIVATEQLKGKKDTMEVFYRDPETDEITSNYEPMTFFVYLNENDDVFNQVYDDTDVYDLEGDLFYNKMIKTKKVDFFYFLKKNADNPFIPYSQAQWMLQTGNTQFKGMDFDDPLRLYCDIETVTKEGHEFPNSTRPEDKIIIISMWTNRGESFILALDEDGNTPKKENVYLAGTEKALLKMFVRTLRGINPDIILGHNFFNFDLPYIEDRAKMHSVPLKIGRNGSTPNSFDTTIKFADKYEDYTNYNVYGRHIIDTYFLAKNFDSVARALESYGLKYCAKFLGKASADRTYVEGGEISDMWKTGDREKLIDYALDDVKETQILDQAWGMSIFEMTKMIPLPLQDVFRYGSGNKVEQFFIREYYKENHSLPKPKPKEKVKGGYANTFKFGLIDQPTAYVDVSSLYPSLGEILGIKPNSDVLEIYQQLVTAFKGKRYEYKGKARELKKEGKHELADKFKSADFAIKVNLNTLAYGYLISQWSMFNDYDEGSRITKWGRKTIKKINSICESMNSTPIRTDTDGSLVTIPQDFIGSFENEMEMIKKVESKLNVWVHDQLETDDDIILDHDGRYKKVMTFDDKSYVLLDYDDQRTNKGNTLTSRSNENFLTEFLNKSVDLLFVDNKMGVEMLYGKYKRQIENKKMGVDDIKKRQNLNMGMEEYKNKRMADSYNPIAQYEAAVGDKKVYEKGDVIETWVEEPEPELKEFKTKPDEMRIPKLPAYKTIRLADDFDGNINRQHYKDRLVKGLKKLMPVIGLERFKGLFPDMSILKDDKAKMLPIWGKDKFDEVFPDFKYRDKDYKKLDKYNK